MARVNPRLEGWHFFALCLTVDDNIKMVRKWCKENYVGRFRIEKQMFPSQFGIPGLKVCRGIVIWSELDDDFMLLKLRWYDYQ